MEFDKFQSVGPTRAQAGIIGREILPCDTVVLAIGQDNAFPFIERNIGLEFGKWDMPVVDKTTFMSTRPGCSSEATPRSVRRTSSGPWSTATRRPSPSTIARAFPFPERPGQSLTLTSTKMGLHQWAYSNNYDHAPRQKMKHVDLGIRFQSMTTKWRMFARADHRGSGAVPELRRADALHRIALHRVRCLRRHLSGGLPDHYAEPVRAGDADAPRRRRSTSISRSTRPPPSSRPAG